MELIAVSFVAVVLWLFGHVATVIAENLRRPKPRIRFSVDDSQTPPPGKVGPISCTRPSEQAVPA